MQVAKQKHLPPRYQARMDGLGRRARQLGLALVLLALCHLSPPGAQASVDIANAPLHMVTSVDPNLMFILDDSGSMHWEITPDEHGPGLEGPPGYRLGPMYVFDSITELYGPRIPHVRLGQYLPQMPSVDSGHVYGAFARSPQGNASFYNPGITYLPWPRADNNALLMANADPKKAYHNPMRPARGSYNLTANITVSSRSIMNIWGHWVNVEPRWVNCISIAPSEIPGVKTISGCTWTGPGLSDRTFFPATYFWHNGGALDVWDNYTRVEIRPGNAPFVGHGRENRSDCADRANARCTYAEEIQNFANWYSYHRSRILAARGGIGRAFATLGENVRIGYGAINAGTSTVDGVSTSRIIRGVRPFRGTDRREFFNLLYDRDIPTRGTPLRFALNAAGVYFSRADNRGPWGSTPGENVTTPHLACRQSFTVLMTDGYWNCDFSNIGNVDNTQGPSITGPGGLPSFRYNPADPFRDGHSNTLADVAMRYWKHDLRDNLANSVPTTAINPAFWQHMVTFGVGLGVRGSIDPAAAWAAVHTGAPIAWPNPVPLPHPNPPPPDHTKLDDLLHAGINSRGGFFSAADPVTFANELAKVLAQIVARVESSATAATASSATLQADTLLYTAGFRSTDWSGTLKAHRLTGGGAVGTLAWDAEALLSLRDPASRSIFTRSAVPNQAMPLAWATLATDQQAALNRAPDNTLDNLGAARIAWLRGTDDPVRFRSRLVDGQTRRIGSIVNADPQLMTRRDFGHSFLAGLEGTSYRDFRASPTYRNRPDVLFVAANSGKLHAFRASDGVELFAYMPRELLAAEPGRLHAPLSRLMAPQFEHRFFMDGSPAIGDAYLNGQWRTVLVGTMGVGGRTVFALDVSDPANFGPANLLWEFTHADLGWGVSQPLITRMANGEWAAVFGNGYNSASHRSMLFVVRLSDGHLLARINTGEGSVTTPNGLASPIATDWPSLNLNANFVYAGDLQGNLWRFDLRDQNVNQWTHANNRKLLFTARDAANNRQPITVKPRLALNPQNNQQVMVLFGTGSYFRNQDGVTAQNTQTLYGIADQQEATWTVGSRATNHLLAQSIVWQGSATVGGHALAVRSTSNNPIIPGTHRGWFLDLVFPAGQNRGERTIAEAVLVLPYRVRFTTMIPDDDPCGVGRTGYLMDLLIASGGRWQTSVFDLHQDQILDTLDLVAGHVITGIQFGAGERVTVIRERESPLELLFPGDPRPGHQPLRGLGSPDDAQPGRHDWRQIR